MEAQKANSRGRGATGNASGRGGAAAGNANSRGRGGATGSPTQSPKLTSSGDASGGATGSPKPIPKAVNASATSSSSGETAPKQAPAKKLIRADAKIFEKKRPLTMGEDILSRSQDRIDLMQSFKGSSASSKSPAAKTGPISIDACMSMFTPMSVPMDGAIPINFDDLNGQMATVLKSDFHGKRHFTDEIPSFTKCLAQLQIEAKAEWPELFDLINHIMPTVAEISKFTLMCEHAFDCFMDMKGFLKMSEDHWSLNVEQVVELYYLSIQEYVAAFPKLDFCINYIMSKGGEKYKKCFTVIKSFCAGSATPPFASATLIAFCPIQFAQSRLWMPLEQLHGILRSKSDPCFGPAKMLLENLIRQCKIHVEQIQDLHTRASLALQFSNDGIEKAEGAFAMTQFIEAIAELTVFPLDASCGKSPTPDCTMFFFAEGLTVYLSAGSKSKAVCHWTWLGQKESTILIEVMVGYGFLISRRDTKQPLCLCRSRVLNAGFIPPIQEQSLERLRPLSYTTGIPPPPPRK